MEILLCSSSVDFFTNNGYLVLDNFFSQEEISELENSLLVTLNSKQNELLSRSRGFYSSILNQNINVWKHNKNFENLISNKKLTSLVKKLLQVKKIRVFQDHALIKDKLDSKPTPWHQDFSYFPINEPDALTVWIPFHDVDKETGCLSYIPKSHSYGKLNEVQMYNPDKPLENEEFKPVIANLKAGSIVIHHALTLHYAYSNTSVSDRLAYAIIYMADGVTYNGKRHPLLKGKSFSKDETISGEDFPLL